AAGVRRVEAVVGSEAVAHIRSQDMILAELQSILQVSAEELSDQVERLLETNRRLEKEISNVKKQNVLGALDSLVEGAEKVGDAFLVVAEVDAEQAEDLRTLGDRIRDRLDPVVILLGSKGQDKVLLLSMVSKSMTQKGLHAGNAVKQAAQICGGGGGGRPDMAQAGGRLPEKLPEALEKSREFFRAQLEGINE
ncbi:MAG TPA: alanine--tRNA ligase, partial [Firmicutes bacterium]|nr:alanine--tRNA ligase [Bacillota bacterium]